MGVIAQAVLYVAAFAAVISAYDASGPHAVSEGEIISDILHREGRKNGLPTPKTDVLLGLYLKSLNEVNFEQGYIEVSGWRSTRWVDPRLRFQYSQPFHRLDRVGMRPDDIWTPDIEVYNIMSTGAQTLNIEPLAIVYYNGTVMYYPIQTMRVQCDLHAVDDPDQEFPCAFKFGSWVYPAHRMDLQIRQVQSILSEYRAAGNWIITEADAQRNEVKYDCCPETYLDITMTIKIKRNPK